MLWTREQDQLIERARSALLDVLETSGPLCAEEFTAQLIAQDWTLNAPVTNERGTATAITIALVRAIMDRQVVGRPKWFVFGTMRYALRQRALAPRRYRLNVPDHLPEDPEAK
jgi:hypothetical protein